jgi:hypothetical protein
MKKLKLFSLLMVLGLVVMSACGDDEENVATGKTGLITAHQWKFSTTEADDEFTVEFTNAFYSGSSYTFSQNGTYAAKLGTAFSNAPYSGVWEFSANESQLILDKGTDEELIFTIETLTSTTLSLTESNVTLVYIK